MPCRVMPAGAPPPTTPAGIQAPQAGSPPRPSFRPASASPQRPAAAKWDHATRVMPAGAAAPVTPAGYSPAGHSAAQAAPATSGLSAEQQAFLERKAAEQPAASGGAAANPVPYSQRRPTPQPGMFGSLAKMPPSTAAAKPAAAAAPAAAAPPRPSFSPAAKKWDHATRVMPAGAAAPVTPAGLSPAASSAAQPEPAAAPGTAGRLSAEQQAFLERKAGETRSPPPPTPVSPCFGWSLPALQQAQERHLPGMPARRLLARLHESGVLPAPVPSAVAPGSPRMLPPYLPWICIRAACPADARPQRPAAPPR